MFETVNKKARRAGSRMSAGALGSLIVHAVLVVIIVILSTREAKPTQKKQIDYSQVTFKDMPTEAPAPPPPPELPANMPPPPPPPPPPPAAAAAPVTETPKVPKKPKKNVQSKPNTMVAAPVDPNPAPPEPVAGGVPGGIEGGVEGGVVGGKIGGVEGGVVGGTGDAPAPVPQNAVLPFGAGMERPRRLKGRDPEFTPQALAAQVEGLMIVRCVIELDGKLEDCKVIKSLPHMEEAVLSALKTHEYTPVMFQGRPQRVNYTFNIKLVAPK